MKTQLHLLVSTEDLKELRLIAADRDESVASLIRRILQAFLKSRRATADRFDGNAGPPKGTGV